jgi:hypothetical protein
MILSQHGGVRGVKNPFLLVGRKNGQVIQDLLKRGGAMRDPRKEEVLLHHKLRRGIHLTSLI